MASMRAFTGLFAAIALFGLVSGPGAFANDHDENRPRYARTELHLVSEGRFVPEGILFAVWGGSGWQEPVYRLATRRPVQVRDENKLNFGRVLDYLNTNITQDITSQRFRDAPLVAQVGRAGDYLVLAFPDAATLARIAGSTRTTYVADSYGKTYVVEGRPKPADPGALPAMGPLLFEVEAKARSTELAIIVRKHR